MVTWDINVTLKNHIDMKLKENMTTPVATPRRKIKRKENNCHRCSKKWAPSHRCASNHLYDCKIIDGKEVEDTV
jgi:hypothetical protein